MKNRKSKFAYILIVLFWGGLFGSTVSVAQPLHPTTPKKIAPKPWQSPEFKASTSGSVSKSSIKSSLDWTPIYDIMYLLALLGFGYLTVKKVYSSITVIWVYITKSLLGERVLSPIDLVRRQVLRKYFTKEEALSLIVNEKKTRVQKKAFQLSEQLDGATDIQSSPALRCRQIHHSGIQSKRHQKRKSIPKQIHTAHRMPHFIIRMTD